LAWQSKWVCELGSKLIHVMLLLSLPLTAARIKDIRCLWLRNQQALKRLRTSKTDGWSMIGADVVDGIVGGEMTLKGWW